MCGIIWDCLHKFMVVVEMLLASPKAVVAKESFSIYKNRINHEFRYFLHGG
jgi:hypothetical protein